MVNSDIYGYYDVYGLYNFSVCPPSTAFKSKYMVANQVYSFIKVDR